MADWIIQFIEQYSYAGVAALMFTGNIFPPLPAERIMPFAGFLAAHGKLHAALVVLSETAGSLLGTSVVRRRPRARPAALAATGRTARSLADRVAQ